MPHDQQNADFGFGQTQGNTATLPASTKPRHLPMFRVLLHNDDNVDFDHVIAALIELTPLTKEEADERANEAHETGCSLIIVIHRERAELYEEQLRSKNLTVTIEPED